MEYGHYVTLPATKPQCACATKYKRLTAAIDTISFWYNNRTGNVLFGTRQLKTHWNPIKPKNKSRKYLIGKEWNKVNESALILSREVRVVSVSSILKFGALSKKVIFHTLFLTWHKKFIRSFVLSTSEDDILVLRAG